MRRPRGDFRRLAVGGRAAVLALAALAWGGGAGGGRAQEVDQAGPGVFREVDAASVDGGEEGAADEGGSFMEAAGGDYSPAEAIPRPYPAERYREIWLKSPFQLEAAGEVAVTQQSFARDYVLSGLIENGPQSIAFIRSKKTGALTKLIGGGEPDGEGFQLVEVKPDPDPKVTSVVVNRHGETAVLRFDSASFAQAAVPSAPAPERPADLPDPRAVNGGRAGGFGPGAGQGAAAGSEEEMEEGIRPGTGPDGEQIINPAASRLQQLRGLQETNGEGRRPDPVSRRRLLLPAPAEQ